MISSFIQLNIDVVYWAYRQDHIAYVTLPELKFKDILSRFGLIWNSTDNNLTHLAKNPTLTIFPFKSYSSAIMDINWETWNITHLQIQSGRLLNRYPNTHRQLQCCREVASELYLRSDMISRNSTFARVISDPGIYASNEKRN